MDNYTISNLVLIILDTKNNYYARKYAEEVLKRRLKYFATNYYDVMNEEEKRINKRGFDVTNYLFSKNPTLQQLMELYFTYSCCNNSNDNLLLFSEKHLCNNMNFVSSFFDNICDMQIDRIDDLIDFVKNTHEKESLRLAKKLLVNRKHQMYDEQQKEFSGLNKLEFNEALLYFDDYKFKPLSFINNPTLHRLYGLKVVLNDSNRLKQQKQILLNSVDTVDYNTPVMQKAFARILTK